MTSSFIKQCAQNHVALLRVHGLFISRVMFSMNSCSSCHLSLMSRRTNLCPHVTLQCRVKITGIPKLLQGPKVKFQFSILACSDTSLQNRETWKSKRKIFSAFSTHRKSQLPALIEVSRFKLWNQCFCLNSVVINSSTLIHPAAVHSVHALT